MMDWGYQGSAIAVPADIADLHRDSWTELGAVGDWWTGADHCEMIREVRAARVCELCAKRREALSPMSIEGSHEVVTGLGPEVVDVIHRLTTDASRITTRWASASVDSLGPGPYAEMVGLVAICHIVDIFCVAVGVDVPSPPQPGDGVPRKHLPDGLDDTETAYVPQRHEPDVANVRRALGCVPWVLGGFYRLVGPMYSGGAFDDLVWDHRALNRPQIELVAARTSALNECFY